MIIPTRREIIIGSAAGLVAGCAPGNADAAPAERWIAYNKRLLDGVARTRPALVSAMAAALLAENNTFRKTEGVGALLDDPELALAAQAQLADLRDRSYFAHESPDGFSPSERAGLLCRTAMGAFGENIAFIENARKPATARQFFEGWRDSPGHRLNMLKADYTHVGHAVLRFGARTYAAAVFGAVSARLAGPLPLAASGADLNVALLAAAPPIRSYMLSPPSGEPRSRPYVALGPGPSLEPGAWRVRAMLPRGAGVFDILWGPVFFAGG